MGILIPQLVEHLLRSFTFSLERPCYHLVAKGMMCHLLSDKGRSREWGKDME